MRSRIPLRFMFTPCYMRQNPVAGEMVSMDYLS